ncbi:MAG TPA: M23 family metallopeptidase [Actinoplanes sp.]|jgi:murein DD-endopeptidase MepM/ murein hydrolase activator NlpD
MSSRILAGIAVTACAVILLCSGLVASLFGGAGAGPPVCAIPAASAHSASAAAGQPSTPAGGDAAIGRWSPAQVDNAAAIVTAGAQKRVPPRGWVIAVATAMQESSLINRPDGADDSVGLFQQRPSQGWGTPAQLQDPAYTARTFYAKLLTIDGWQAMPLTEAAQKVQHSAYPDAYAKWEPDATALIRAITGLTDGLGACGVTISAKGWTQPLHGPVGSGFRTADRPGHDGVDISVPKGTLIHAAAAGTVSAVRCNAVYANTGAEYGCDRDGDPDLTRGCGWYVDITHPGGVITRYCHQLRQPPVREGQHVAAGDVIGVVGSSGHSSGPHLHYEVHLGDHTSATATDPVAFMASVNAPLAGNWAVVRNR